MGQEERRVQGLDYGSTGPKSFRDFRETGPWAPFLESPGNYSLRPVKPKQSLEPYDYRAVLFTFSQYEERFTSYKKFQAYTLLHFYIQMNEKWLYGPEEFPGLSRNGHPSTLHRRTFENEVFSRRLGLTLPPH